MDREIVRRIADEAREEEANLVVWDKRDTFTIEPKAEVSVEDDYLAMTNHEVDYLATTSLRRAAA